MHSHLILKKINTKKVKGILEKSKNFNHSHCCVPFKKLVSQKRTNKNRDGGGIILPKVKYGQRRTYEHDYSFFFATPMNTTCGTIIEHAYTRLLGSS